MELFATGDQDPQYIDPALGQPFSSVPHVTLTGTANNAPFTLSSLNGTDWVHHHAAAAAIAPHGAPAIRQSLDGPTH